MYLQVTYAWASSQLYISGVQHYDLWSALNQLFVVPVGSKLLSHLYIHNYNVLVITVCANL